MKLFVALAMACAVASMMGCLDSTDENGYIGFTMKEIELPPQGDAPVPAPWWFSTDERIRVRGLAPGCGPLAIIAWRWSMESDLQLLLPEASWPLSDQEAAILHDLLVEAGLRAETEYGMDESTTFDEGLLHALRSYGYQPIVVHDFQAVREALQNGGPVIVEERFPTGKGHFAIICDWKRLDDGRDAFELEELWDTPRRWMVHDSSGDCKWKLFVTQQGIRRNG